MRQYCRFRRSRDPKGGKQITLPARAGADYVVSRGRDLLDLMNGTDVAGIVWINCRLFRDLRTPFGVMKQSGKEREAGFEALRLFTEEKDVGVKINC